MSSTYTLGTFTGTGINGTLTGIDYTSEFDAIVAALQSLATTQASMLTTLNTISGTLNTISSTLNSVETTLSKLEGDVSVISGLAAGDGIHHRDPSEWTGAGASFSTVATTYNGTNVYHTFSNVSIRNTSE